MTNDERTLIANDFLNMIFRLREPPSEDSDFDAGAAWVIETLSAGIERAILSQIGPDGSPDPMIEAVGDKMRNAIMQVQTTVRRRTLEIGSPANARVSPFNGGARRV